MLTMMINDSSHFVAENGWTVTRVVDMGDSTLLYVKLADVQHPSSDVIVRLLNAYDSECLYLWRDSIWRLRRRSADGDVMILCVCKCDDLDPY